jgi:hypothetical protein
MTSIYDIPYEDIKKFLDANNKNFVNKEDAYNKTLILLKDKKSVGHTISIIEWMIAHNLLIKKVNIPNYTIGEIDNMSQIEIDKLAKLLTMSGNNKNNIKNILKYLHKLNDIELISDIKTDILNILTRSELQDIDIENLDYESILNLLKTHRNKKEIRKFLYDNMEKIIFYMFWIDSSDVEELLNRVNIYNKNIIIEIIMTNKYFKENYSNEEINDLIEKVKNNDNDNVLQIYIHNDVLYDLINFIIDLITNDEKTLAKKVFDSAHKIGYYGSFGTTINEMLFSVSAEKNNTNVLKSIINFMGEDEFLKNYESVDEEIDILENLTKLKKYDLLLKIIDKIEISNKDITRNEIFRNIKNAIQLKNDDLIIEYIKIIF